MKRISLLLLALVMSLSLSAQQSRADKYSALPVHQGGIIIAGDSITDDCEWNELFGTQKILNRGQDGNNSSSILERVHELTRHHPEKFFLAIGTNDLPHNTIEKVMENVTKICDTFQKESPSTKIYIESVLPIGPNPGWCNDPKGKAEAIVALNKAYKEFCQKRGYTFVDVWSSFIGKDGWIKEGYSIDDLHVYGETYNKWKEVLTPYIIEGTDIKPRASISQRGPIEHMSEAFQAGKVRRSQVFSIADNHKGAILFAGGSIMEDCEWKEMFHNDNIYNRGIDGATVSEFEQEIPELVRHGAKAVFIEIGSAEVATDPEAALSSIKKVVDALKAAEKKTKVYVLSVLPSVKADPSASGNPMDGMMMGGKPVTLEQICQYNADLKKMCKKSKAIYVDLYSAFLDGDGMDPKYGSSNTKLTPQGYQHFAETLSPYVAKLK